MPNPKSRSATAAAPSIEDIRRRARHRLIGAAVLVLIGVVGFPLLFDTQPRPIAVDVPIEIPSRQNAPALTPAPAPAPAAAAAPAPAPVPAATPAPAPAPVAAAPAAPAPAPVAPARPDPKPEPKPEAKPAPAAKPAANDGQRAQALLNDKATERVVVQVGAYAEEARAREVRQRLERAGLKTYTHVAQTPEGQRIRVRIGPFDSKAEADKAAAKVKALGLPTAILTL